MRGRNTAQRGGQLAQPTEQDLQKIVVSLKEEVARNETIQMNDEDSRVINVIRNTLKNELMGDNPQAQIENVKE